MEIFQTFAEISIGILGFTSIVMAFKSQQPNWNKHAFEGMIGHCIQVLVYSILPFILEAYHCEPSTIWTICCCLLGSATFFQAFGIIFIDKVVTVKTKLIIFVFASIIATLQFFNVFGIWTEQEKGPYIIGVAYHVMNALIIFTGIVTKKTEANKKPKS